MKPTAVNIYLMKAKKSQKEMAETLGLHKSTVSLLLAGKIRLEARLDQIAAYLGISRKRLDRLIASNGATTRRAA